MSVDWQRVLWNYYTSYPRSRVEEVSFDNAVAQTENLPSLIISKPHVKLFVRNGELAIVPVKKLEGVDAVILTKEDIPALRTVIAKMEDTQS